MYGKMLLWDATQCRSFTSFQQQSAQYVDTDSIQQFSDLVHHSVDNMLQCSLCVLLQVDELSTQHRHHLAENAALAECQTLMQEAASGWQATTRAAKAASQAALMQAGQEYMHAATRHLYYQRALLQLLLRQLTFCVGELQGVLTCLPSWSSGLPDCLPCHDKTHLCQRVAKRVDMLAILVIRIARLHSFP